MNNQPQPPAPMQTLRFVGFLTFSYLAFVALDAELWSLAALFVALTIYCTPSITPKK